MSRIAYFECREDNHDKFYLMTEDPTGTTFVARWGRIGTEGSFCAYSISNWNKKLHERLSHGYVDRTQDYLDGKINGPAAWTGVGEAKYKMSGIPGKAVVTGRRLSYEQNLLESAYPRTGKF